jgi:uroporphyrinogen III methyltransferase/synthase
LGLARREAKSDSDSISNSNFELRKDKVLSGESDPQTLAGKRIVVTRSRRQASQLGDRLEARGATVIYCPAIRVTAPTDPSDLERAVRRIESYDWLILTSTNGVEAFAAELRRQGKQPGQLTGIRFACVGPATAAALGQFGVTPDVIPAEYKGSEIASAVAGGLAADSRILLIRAAGADPELPERLEALNALVDDVVAYRSVADLENVEEVRLLLETDGIDAITFTSPSTVTYFVEAVGKLPGRIVLSAIGPVTAARIREHGLVPAIVAGEHTISGLVEAISDHFSISNESA